MRGKHLLVCLAVVGVVGLSGCQNVSPTTLEKTYATGATTAAVGLLTGVTPQTSAGDVCKGDDLAYAILQGQRVWYDVVVDEKPADDAHAKLQTAGAPFSPTCKAP